MPLLRREGLVAPSRDWSSNIVSGKVYDGAAGPGRALYEQLERRLHSPTQFDRDRQGLFGYGERDGVPIVGHPSTSNATKLRLSKIRLGQAAFRLNVARAYSYECAISETKVLPALEAAHLRPFGNDGPNDVSNGVFLRRDIHSVYDAGFLTFDEEYRLVVSKTVKTVFNNGQEYRRLHGERMKLLKDEALRPDSKFLDWHRENVYVGD